MENFIALMFTFPQGQAHNKLLALRSLQMKNRLCFSLILVHRCWPFYSNPKRLYMLQYMIFLWLLLPVELD